MTPAQLAYAARCYIAMRSAVTLAGKSPGIGIDVLLSDTRSWPSARVWHQLWPLFFYSGMKTKFAEPRAAALAGLWFDDCSVLATAIHDSTHSWHVREVKATKTITKGTRKGKSHTYLAAGTEACSFCGRTGICSGMPYKTGAMVTAVRNAGCPSLLASSSRALPPDSRGA